MARISDGTFLLAAIIGVNSGVWAKRLGALPRAIVRASVTSAPQFVYVANAGNRSVSEYRMGSGGALVAIGTVGTTGSPELVRVDPVKPYVYVLNGGLGSLAYPNISEYFVGTNGRLHVIGTVALNADCADIVIGPMGRHVYGANSNGKILNYVINAHGVLHL